MEKANELKDQFQHSLAGKKIKDKKFSLTLFLNHDFFVYLNV